MLVTCAQLRQIIVAHAPAEPVNARLLEALKKCISASDAVAYGSAIHEARSAIAAAEAQQAGPVRLTEADLQECKRLADAGSPVPHMSWSQRLAFAIEAAVLERNGLNPHAKPAYGPDNPPRLRRADESVEAYREAMGWTANDQPQANGD